MMVTLWNLAVLAHIAMADCRQHDLYMWIHSCPLFFMCNGLHIKSMGTNISYEYEMMQCLQLKWA